MSFTTPLGVILRLRRTTWSQKLAPYTSRLGGQNLCVCPSIEVYAPHTIAHIRKTAECPVECDRLVGRTLAGLAMFRSLDEDFKEEGS